MKNETLLVSRAALLGDKDAFGRLVEIYQSSVRRFFYNLTGGDEERSKDLAQETFIKAWLNIASFRAAASFSTWLYRIAYNEFYDSCRTGKTTVGMDDAYQSEMIYNNVANIDFGMDFAHALLRLKENERTAVLLFYMEDKPIKKIATIMNCPVGTVKSHLYRGREKLIVYLKSAGYDKRK
jgi:RNA polymerase sigma-70 factor (ECF subfamily)